MLKEEQAAQLLLRCEKIVGKQLAQIRGNLKKAETRAAAIWELLVIEATSFIGKIEYEPHPGGSPDIRLHFPHRYTVWIEVAYLYPRFWNQERRSDAVLNWLFREAKRRSIPPWKIQPQFYGDTNNQAGPIRNLPDLHERRIFLEQPELIKFFEDISSKPNENYNCRLSHYTISISYVPNAKGPYLLSGGLVQESPKTIKEHAVYRVIKRKAGQHNVTGPRIICIGSDQSPVLSLLSAPTQPTVRTAVVTALQDHRSISAVILVSIETITSIFGQFQRRARGEIFLNPHASDPFTKKEYQQLCKLNFNRWKYTYTLKKWEPSRTTGFSRVSGSLTWRPRGMGMEIEVPVNIVIDALAGKTSLFKEYQLSENDPIAKALNDGWVIDSCSMKKGNIEAGVAHKVVIQLIPPSLAVYWPRLDAKQEKQVKSAHIGRDWRMRISRLFHKVRGSNRYCVSR